MNITLAIVSTFGGVVLLLYGMKIAGEGLRKAAGGQLRTFMLSATSNRLKAVGVGAAITALLQSSSATTVMLVGFVGSGLIGLTETMGVILGADIGTTLTVQIIAFEVYDYAIFIVGIGALMVLVQPKGVYRHYGEAVLGFGFVFLSLKILIDTLEPAAEGSFISELLLSLGGDPIAGIIVAAALTALFQSSAATLGLAITAAHTGLLTIDAALPVVLGANIGTCATAVVSSMGAPVDSKRVALAHILFKVVGVLVVLPFIGPFSDLVAEITSDGARQVAVAHTVFNIGLAALFLPFTGVFTAVVKKLIPDRPVAEKFGPKYLDPIVLSTPSLAFGQATREALRVADIVQEMLSGSIDVILKKDHDLCEKIEEMDDDVDMLDREIKLYLTKLSKESLSDDEARREFEILAFTDNMENIGDVIDKNLMELAHKGISQDLHFSEEGREEIADLHRKVLENFDVGVAAFTEADVGLAHRLLDRKTRIGEHVRELREAHITRLHEGLTESIDTSAIHLDILTNLKRVNSYITNIAYTLLEREKAG